MSPQELRLPMPWGHIAAKAWGSPNDRRVLAVHGILDNAGSFDRLISLLPSGYYFVCIDLPGHGLSSHFPKGMPLEYLNYILAIRRVLDYLNWESCIYIGHSLGANLGTMFTSIYPERVTKLICLDAVVARPISNDVIISYIRSKHDNAINIEEKTDVARLYTIEEIIYLLMNFRYNALNRAAAEALSKRIITKVGDKYSFTRDPRLKLGLLPIFNYEQHSDILKHTHVPTLVVFSTTTVTTEHHKEMARINEYAMVNFNHNHVVVEGNHDVHNNHPERVAPHITEFLTALKSNL